MSAALTKVLVADFTHVFAGPYCTMSLADMGAEVVKIEPPQGDSTRGYVPPALHGESPSFLCMNRNKKGVVLDLRDERARTIATDLVRRADVVVENFATGVMERLGLDYETVSKSNKRLIYCSISAYGRSGPFAKRAGYDPVIQAESGLMSLNGDPEGVPYRSGVAFVDLCTGMFAAQAILAALYAREATDCGQFIEVPLYDSAAYLAGYHTMSYLVGGTHGGRVGNSSPVIAPVGLYDTCDGQLFLTVGGDAVWSKLVKALGEPEVLACAEYSTNSGRVHAAKKIDAALQDLLAREQLSHWIELFRSTGVPAGPVRTIPEAADSSEAKERKIFGTAPHSTAGSVPNIRSPLRMTGTPIVQPTGAPVLGEHTLDVLVRILGYSVESVSRLNSDGVFGPDGVVLR